MAPIAAGIPQRLPPVWARPRPIFAGEQKPAIHCEANKMAFELKISPKTGKKMATGGRSAPSDRKQNGGRQLGDTAFIIFGEGEKNYSNFRAWSRKAKKFWAQKSAAAGTRRTPGASDCETETAAESVIFCAFAAAATADVAPQNNP